MSRANDGIVVGGAPRIDLLPPEIKQRKAARRHRRIIFASLIGVLIVCVLAYMGVSSLAVGTQVTLAFERARTDALLMEQGEYSEVRQAEARVEQTRDARLVASANEVHWAPYLQSFAATLPEGVTIDTISITSISALEAHLEASDLLATQRIGTVTVSLVAPTIPELELWLRNVAEVPGYAGARMSSVVLEDRGYIGSATVDIDASVLERRFFEEPLPDEAEDPAASDAPAEGGE